MPKAQMYFDHNATTPLHRDVWAAMQPWLTKVCGNPSSLHSEGQRARDAVEEARDHVAQSLGTTAAEIIFTGGGTEADNLAILGSVLAQHRPGGHIVTSLIEHPAVLGSCRFLETQGFRVTRLPVSSQGVIDPDDLTRVLSDDTVLVTLMHANNEVGTIQPLRDCAAMARARGILVHTDAVQSVGKISTLVDELGVDLLSLSGHKIYGPKGVGALYVRRGIGIHPVLTGGPQEQGLRGGTESVVAIVGLGAAARLATLNMPAAMSHAAALHDRLEQGVLATIHDVAVNGAMAPRLPTTTNLSFRGVDGQSLVVALDLQGVAASTGSACSSGSIEPSHVLRAMGLSDEWLPGSVRLSVGAGNTPDEVETLLQILPPIVARLRQHGRGSGRGIPASPAARRFHV